jgi:nucleoside 2-deoxyribosyltransferase
MKQTGDSARRSYYLAGAIRGDTSFLEYQQLIRKVVNKYGEVYTERSESYIPLDKYAGARTVVKEQEIFDRDMRWLLRSDALVAEISGASTGTGYEIREAIAKPVPVFCLYHKSSRPSLIIKRIRSEYVIVQEYEGQKDLEAYLTCFMELVSKTDDIDEIRRIYSSVSQQVARIDFQTDKIGECVKPLLRALHEIGTIDFKDSKDFVAFMFKNVILQSRWDRLRSQRIGSTFISGDKPQIIRELTQFDLNNRRNVAPEDCLFQASDIGTHNQSHEKRHSTIHLTHIYQQLRRSKVKYNRWALTKNLRAFRRIGLVLSDGEIGYGASKFRDQLHLVVSLSGRKLVSSTSHRSIANPKIRPTKHIHDLFAFISKYGAQPLVDFLIEFRKTEWFKIVSDLQTNWQLNIDHIRLDDVLDYDWSPKLVEDLKKMCQEIWENFYSSFSGAGPHHVSNGSNSGQLPNALGEIDSL